ncbi:heat-inducible transcriptional repressor HrcA [Arhodomonas sp. AD133]|uniref:heat-inducible transcriptional repressor HrcA n=1 Tax=Arhodomonas sp. AD133 TaxID=3415009 RepID=UPI003EB8A12C
MADIKTGDTVLNERAQRLLKTLVQRYIRDGQPVGSRVLTRESGLDLSPATVRNVMSDLEDAGLVCSPHTSAGRVPTDLGYRFFVDSLLTVQPLGDHDIDRLRIRLEGDGDAGSLVDSASSLLSGLTRLTGVVTLPRRNYGALRQLEFLRLSERRILAILVLNDHEVQNRVIETDRDFSASELQQLSNYLNSEFAGRDMASVRHLLLAQMQADREHMNSLMQTAIDVAKRVFAEHSEADEDYVMAGETNLMTFSELSNVDKLKELFDAFSRKRDILHLLDRCLSADGVQIFIGEESGYEIFDGVSLVTSSYRADGEVLGVLGVIGPTRMDYDRVIPIVDVTARLLGHALNPGQ